MARKRAKKLENSRDLPTSLYRELAKLKQKFDLSDDQLIQAISQPKPRSDIIPLSIFSSKLSSFEAIVKYLRENCSLNFREIGELTNRSKFSVSGTYRKSKSKLSQPFKISYSEYDIPIKIIADRRLSVLESIVVFLHDNRKMKFSEIAQSLNLDPRTVWTVYQRAKKKT